jgi:hypothetical protein
MQERRKERRIRADYVIAFRPIEEQANIVKIGYTRNVSSGGMYVYTRAKPPVGERLALKIHIPSDWAEGGDPPNLEGEGGVLRIDPGNGLQSQTVNGMAIQFFGQLSVNC